MITEAPALDWLTLTTYQRNEFVGLRNRWLSARDRMRMREGGEVRQEASKIMQYEGSVIDGVFMGSAMQRGREHYMVRAGGDTSMMLWGIGGLNAWRCTRVDIQLTLPQWPRYSAQRLADQMESANWTGSRGQGRRKPSITLVRSSDGLNTVYAGSRQSERFLRVYVKPDREGYRYVRYELEIKGKTADRIFTKLLNDYGFNVVGILSDSIGRIPQEVSELDPFREFMEGIEGVAVVSGRKIADHSATLLWLEQTVTASVSKCLGNHNTRDDTIAWVNQLVDMVQRIEK